MFCLQEELKHNISVSNLYYTSLIYKTHWPRLLTATESLFTIISSNKYLSGHYHQHSSFRFSNHNILMSDK